MPDPYPATTIILAEISIVLLAIFVYLVIRYLRNYRDLTQALSRLAQKFRTKRDDRLTMLKTFLQETCNYPETRAEEVAAELLMKEKLFYTTIMEIYMNRDNAALKNLDQTTEQMISAYRNLLSVTMESVTQDAQHDLESRTRDLSATITQLTEKNKAMDLEIKKLQQEMQVTLTEYASAFARDQAAKQTAKAALKEAASTADDDIDDPAPPDPDEHSATPAMDAIDSGPMTQDQDEDTLPAGNTANGNIASDEIDEIVQSLAESQADTADTSMDTEHPVPDEPAMTEDGDNMAGASASSSIQFPEQDNDEEFPGEEETADMPDTPDDSTQEKVTAAASDLDNIVNELENLAANDDESDDAGNNSVA